MCDSGKYHCEVSNPGGRVSSSTSEITIIDADALNQQQQQQEPTSGSTDNNNKNATEEPTVIGDTSSLEDDDESIFYSKPRFVEYFSDVYAETAAEAKFTCRIVGRPEPKVTWYCNYRKLAANDDTAKYAVLTSESAAIDTASGSGSGNGGVVHTLVVKSVAANDEGEYTCKASNVKGECSWSANLYMNEPASSTRPPQAQAGGEFVAPNFLRKLKDSTVCEEHTASLDFMIDGEPFPLVRLFKNNSAVDLLASPSDKYALDLDTDSGLATLHIRACQRPGDEDEYTVRLENAAGRSECSAYLSVESSDETKSKQQQRRVRFSLPNANDIFLIPRRAPAAADADDPSHHAGPPEPPGLPTIDADAYERNDGTSLTLAWPASPSSSSSSTPASLTYIVEYRTPRSHVWSVYASGIEALGVLVDHLLPGLNYSFRVRAENASGISDASPVVSTKTLLAPAAAAAAEKLQPSDQDSKRKRLELDETKYRAMECGGVPVIVADAKDVRYYIEGERADLDVGVFGFPTPSVTWMHNGSVVRPPSSDDGDTAATGSPHRIKMYRDSIGSEHLDILCAA